MAEPLRLVAVKKQDHLKLKKISQKTDLPMHGIISNLLGTKRGKNFEI